MTFTDPPELLELESLVRLAGTQLERRLLCEVSLGAKVLPVCAFILGSNQPDAPAVGFFG